MMQGKLGSVVGKKEKRVRGKLSREINNVRQKILATPFHHRKRLANLKRRLAELIDQQKIFFKNIQKNKK